MSRLQLHVVASVFQFHNYSANLMEN
ncbi:Protein of unknown function [Bacillus cytotoxicus]|uniref:Uncharacterized protein n=1 Tax=Bacillus cytotoxicus TaxID=580165 RepID=A0AAX2CHM2_9BACI|nr:Protein of unknown function [Bacillus cytotoxicus]SCN37177.1 Protein of unknown function [Bacillus cytotoxicus]